LFGENLKVGYLNVVNKEAAPKSTLIVY